MAGWDQPPAFDETSFVFAEGTPSSMEIGEMVAPPLTFGRCIVKHERGPPK